MVRTYEAAPGIEILTTPFPIPGYGVVPLNAFLLRGPEPMLVDTGAWFESEDFVRVLRSVIDPRELRWIWLTHTDFDHTGSLQPLLAENPRLRVVTTFLGAGILSLVAPLPPERLYFVNPGETLTVAGHTLRALRPPTFDNPCTTGFFDETSGVLFSSDCFGALLPEVPDRADQVRAADLSEGQVFWTTVDAPWVHLVDASAFATSLDRVRRLQPSLILGSHLPPAPGHMLERLLGSVAAARTAPPFVGPDQAGFQQMLGAMATATLTASASPVPLTPT